MSYLASVHVTRHVLRQVSAPKGVLLEAFALAANDEGVTRDYTQKNACQDIGCSLITIKRNMAVLLRPPEGAPGPFLEKMSGRRYKILGVEHHDQRHCGNAECRAEAEAVQGMSAREVGEGKTEAKRRKAAAAARARAYRARRREATQK